MAESTKKRFSEHFNRDKSKLLNLLKRKGQYIRFSESDGYLYSLEIGESAGMAIFLEVAMKAGTLKILDVFSNQLAQQN